jgi:hypothetical protein
LSYNPEWIDFGDEERPRADSGLIKKLLLKPGQKAAVLNPPAGYLEGLGPLPEGAELVARPNAPLDFVHLFVRDKDELDKLTPQAIRLLKDDGIFWVSYPKGSAKVKTNLNRDKLWKFMKGHGFDGVAMVSIDETWSAMRFRPKDKVGKSRKD